MENAAITTAMTIVTGERQTLEVSAYSAQNSSGGKTRLVDRLTRSLADFAKLVETFDAHEASFVSVTQGGLARNAASDAVQITDQASEVGLEPQSSVFVIA